MISLEFICAYDPFFVIETYPPLFLIVFNPLSVLKGSHRSNLFQNAINNGIFRSNTSLSNVDPGMRRISSAIRDGTLHLSRISPIHGKRLPTP